MKLLLTTACHEALAACAKYSGRARWVWQRVGPPAGAQPKPAGRATPPPPSVQRTRAAQQMQAPAASSATAAAAAAPAAALDGLDDLGGAGDSRLASPGGDDDAGDAFAMFGDLDIGSSHGGGVSLAVRCTTAVQRPTVSAAQTLRLAPAATASPATF